MTSSKTASCFSSYTFFFLKLVSVLFLITLLYLIIISVNRPPFSDASNIGNGYTGKEAEKRILSFANLSDQQKDFPPSAREFYLYEGGSVHGTIRYLAFTCDSLEECWKAIEVMGAPIGEKFTSWEPSDLAITMEGPGYYDTKFKTDLWDVRGIKKGLVYEIRQGKNRNQRLVYYAIDTDKNRVYHHYESGGFPDKKWSPR